MIVITNTKYEQASVNNVLPRNAAVVVTKMEHHAGRGDVTCCPHPHTNEKFLLQ